jgi:catechol 2,3-dioxygenase-like lactoylglutathione lyase family enzyme
VSGARTLGVLHPVVITRDMEGALGFYRDLLGLRVRDRVKHDPAMLSRLGGPADAEASAAVLEAPDGTEIEVACFARPEGKRRTDAGWADAGIRSVTFVVDDLDAMAARLAAGGYPTLGEVLSVTWEGTMVKVAYVAGPDGVVLTLLEREGQA